MYQATLTLDPDRLAIARIFRRFARRGTVVLAERNKMTADLDAAANQDQDGGTLVPSQEHSAAERVPQ